MNPRVLGFLFILAAFVLAGLFAGDLLIGADQRRSESWSVYSADPDNPDRAYQPLPDIRPERQTMAELVAEQFDREMALTRDELKAAHAHADYEYVIKSGDVLDDLAKKYLGRPNLKTRIFEANPNLRPGNVLTPGTKIVIPFRFRID